MNGRAGAVPSPGPSAAWSASFSADPGSIADAREFVLLTTSVRELPLDVRDAVLLVVSELASNAFRHGGSAPYTVGVQGIAGGVRVTVTDTGGGEPAALRPGLADPSGRGLRIVEAFSDAWGVSRTTGVAGKSVWSEVRRR